jgi:hypothetical protein
MHEQRQRDASSSSFTNPPTYPTHARQESPTAFAAPNVYSLPAVISTCSPPHLTAPQANTKRKANDPTLLQRRGIGG